MASVAVDDLVALHVVARWELATIHLEAWRQLPTACLKVTEGLTTASVCNMIEGIMPCPRVDVMDRVVTVCTVIVSWQGLTEMQMICRNKKDDWNDYLTPTTLYSFFCDPWLPCLQCRDCKHIGTCRNNTPAWICSSSSSGQNNPPRLCIWPVNVKKGL